jgi:predicted Ser/Thr protein kinase
MAGIDLTRTEAASAAEAPTRLPAQIGRHRVDRVLGAGGMGVVYAAYDADLERMVAIKVLRGGAGASAEGRARFLREARAMARVAHRNVITVHEVGTDGDVDFVAMELIEGASLAEWLEAPRRRDEVLAVFRQAGEGLAAAHAAGLVHRDFKPHNVLVGRDGRVVVTDFGLARAADEPGPGAAPSSSPAPAGDVSIADAATMPGEVGMLATLDAQPSGRTGTRSSDPLTRTGAVLGTPAYMPPEQHAGAGCDPRSDQFSFCVALWEGLAGARPFVGATLEELRAAVERGLPPDAGRSLPRGVRRVLRRGLSRDPAARWPSLATLLVGLDRAETRRRRGIAGAIAAAVAVVTAAAIALWPAPAAAPCPLSRDGLDPAWRSATVAGRVVDRGRRDWLAARDQACRAPSPAVIACLGDVRERLAAVIDALRAAPGDVARASDPSPLVPDAGACLATAPPSVPPAADAPSRRRARTALAAIELSARAAATTPAEADAALAAIDTGGDCAIAAERLLLSAALRVRRGDETAARADLESAELEAERCGHDLARASAAVARFGDAVELEVGADQLASVRARTEAALDRAGRPALLVASLAGIDAVVARRAARFSDAVDAGSRALAARREHGAVRGALDITREIARSLLLREAPGDLALRRLLLAAAVADAVAAFGPDDPAALDAMASLADAVWRHGDAAAAHRLSAAIRASLTAPSIVRARAWTPAVPRTRVRGTVVDTAGRPVAGAAVFVGRQLLFDSLGFDPFGVVHTDPVYGITTTTSDAAGRFEADAASGSMVAAAAGDRLSLPVLVAGADTRVVLRPTGGLRGRIVFTPTRPPGVIALAKPAGFAPQYGVFAAVAADGTWTIDRVPEGRFTVFVEGQRGQGSVFNSVTVTVRAGAVATVDIPWVTGDARLDVVVRGDRSAPIEQARVLVGPPGVRARTVGELESLQQDGHLVHVMRTEKVGRRAAPLAPGDLVAHIDGLQPGAASVCVMPLTADIFEPAIAARITGQTGTLDAVCTQVTVGPPEPVIVEVQPMRRLP